MKGKLNVLALFHFDAKPEFLKTVDFVLLGKL